MTHYVLTMFQPEGPGPSAEELAPVMAGLGAIREELEAAGSWVFAGGLHPPSSATVVRRSGTEMLVTDGPFLEGKEYVGGFTIIDVPDLDEALVWARRTAVCTGLPIEVRPFAG